MAVGYEQIEYVEKLLFSNKINEAIDELYKIISAPIQSCREAMSTREVAVMMLGSTLATHSMTDELGDLISNTCVSISGFSKIKLIRSLVDQFLDIKSDVKYTKGVELCKEMKECIDWATSGSKVHLKQALESRLISLYIEMCKYSEALQLASKLLKELKMIGDKALLVEVQLLESSAYQEVRKVSRERKNLSFACVSDESGEIQVTVVKGRYWDCHGYNNKGKLFLIPLEALYMMECGVIQITSGVGQPLTMQQAYHLFLMAEQLASFQVYASLKRTGYIVLFSHPQSRSHHNYKGLFVYKRNGVFRKSSPGDPDYIILVTSGGCPVICDANCFPMSKLLVAVIDQNHNIIFYSIFVLPSPKN